MCRMSEPEPGDIVVTVFSIGADTDAGIPRIPIGTRMRAISRGAGWRPALVCETMDGEHQVDLFISFFRRASDLEQLAGAAE